MPADIFCGVDPGLDGAVAFIAGSELIVHDMPTVRLGGKNKRTIDHYALADIFRGVPVVAGVKEKVSARPNEGVTSSFSFGRSAGVLEGIIAALQMPFEDVTPFKWQKAMRVPQGKDGSRARACQLFPQFSHVFKRVKDHGRADATLIAAYCMQLQGADKDTWQGLVA